MLKKIKCIETRLKKHLIIKSQTYPIDIKLGVWIGIEKTKDLCDVNIFLRALGAAEF